MLVRRTVALVAASALLVSGGAVAAMAAGPGLSDVTPDRRIVDASGPGLQRGVDVDAAGRVYTVNSDREIRVHAPGANGNAVPVRTIAGDLTQLADSANVAVGADGRLYVVSYPAPSQPIKILVFAPDATGNTAPERVITGANTKLDDTKSLAVGPDGSIYVIQDDASLNGRILVFAPGADGDVAPLRTITGSKTGLISPEDAAVDAAGNIFVSEWNPGFVNVYSKTANGNVAPFRTLKLSNPELWQATRLDVDHLGYVYVGGYSGNRVFVFASGASGTAAPIGVISGPKSRVNKPWNIAVDGARNIFVGNYASDEVTVYKPLVRMAAVGSITVKGASTAKTFNVSWTPPPVNTTGRALTGYTVTLKQGNTTLLTRTLTGRSMTIGRKDLKSGTHVVTVAARNQVGTGTAKSKSFKVTAIKPARVRSVTVGGKNAAATRTVRWKAPEWTGGATVTKYRIVVKKGSKKLVVVTVKGSKRSVKVKKWLLRSGKHQVSVQAYNSKGYGPSGTKTFRVVR